MSLVPRKLSLTDRVLRAEKRLRRLETRRSLGNSTISEGDLTVKSEGAFKVIDAETGRVVAIIGALPGDPDGEDYRRADGSRQPGLALYREDGSMAAFLGDFSPTTPPYKQAWQVLDRSGNIVMADDTNSGLGIAVPYVPAGMFGDAAVPTAVTTSATYEELQWADVYQQHPRVTAGVLVYTPAGTSGRFRLKLGTTPIPGSEVIIPSNTFTMLYTDDLAWPGTFDFSSRQLIVLEARRDSGTGGVGVRGLGLWGKQS